MENQSEQRNLETAFQQDPESDQTYVFEQRALRNQQHGLRQLCLDADQNSDPARHDRLMHSIGTAFWNALMMQADHDVIPELRPDELCPACRTVVLKNNQHMCSYCDARYSTDVNGISPYDMASRGTR